MKRSLNWRPFTLWIAQGCSRFSSHATDLQQANAG
jgi:hypothetical protein